MDSVSYALGVLFAKNLSDQGFNSLDGASLRDGFEHALAGTSNLTVEQADALVRSHLTALKEEADKQTLAEGEAYLQSNGLKEGVVTTPTGLQYRHEVMGQGPSPDANDEVTVHYRGTLIHGEEFDSSYRRGEPTSFPLNGVIRGWTEGLQTMNVGGKTTFFIPQDLAYGARPAPGGKVPPYAALIFEVELLEVRSVD
ncbi:MAG: FKBP-type peptidyl-prolyl cis-trans isomerase [Bacteroidetes bacterium]|nr:FKBP-type peptidyl-prolyl cis-trans isomerase [Bacteroidota bacterium]MDA0903763.1 FKBP-type peptidyl-prolyl cis-trans isomerase [Bacteroidota bacterium]MDA1242557.1 FKBP-type peptidyl-prolyl cis-trans isomerase [Bacteroidota bacterium]